MDLHEDRQTVLFRSKLVQICGQMRRAGFKPLFQIPSGVQMCDMFNSVNSLRYEHSPLRFKLEMLLLCFSHLEIMLAGSNTNHGLKEEDKERFLQRVTIPLILLGERLSNLNK
jgi:hypothetical protein